MDEVIPRTPAVIKRALLLLLVVSLAPALRGICFRNPGQGNDFNTNAPSGTYASAAWLWDVMAIEPIGGMFYLPIGPQLMVVPAHVGATIGEQLSIQGQTVTITNVIKSTNQVDALYAQASGGDSGGPFFLDCGVGSNKWRLVGFMTSGYQMGSQVLFHQELSSGGWGFYVDRGLIDRLNTPPGCAPVYRP
jgi:hypothetical protein